MTVLSGLLSSVDENQFAVPKVLIRGSCFASVNSFNQKLLASNTISTWLMDLFSSEKRCHFSLIRFSPSTLVFRCAEMCGKLR